MNLWILTIGSSDVQLISDQANQAKGRTEKQRSDKVWSYWYTDDLQADCYDISFEPKQPFKDKEETYRIAPRILGRVYQASDQLQQNEIWDYLTFPLLDNFVQALADYPAPEEIAVLLTDQSTIFESDRQRKTNSPYWQDTCELKPILRKYFAEKFPDASCEFIPLIPGSEAQSLDNWNAVLDLVREKFRNLTIADQPIHVEPTENVYVSHQAGTPAISSAVQFCSLAKFDDCVIFLVSNEQDSSLTNIVESSTYLRGIKREQAKKLLDNYDYAGIRDVVGEYLTGDNKTLLEAALQWNYARFDNHDGFADQLEKLSDQHLKSLTEESKESRKKWWWTAYEAAYLAWIRLEQDNVVDAFFHGFRSIEGGFSNWGKKAFGSYVEIENERAFLQPSILDSPKDYFKNAKFNNDGTPKNSIAKLKQKLVDLAERIKKAKETDQKSKGLLLSGDDLYILFRTQKPDYQDSGLDRFWNAENGIGEKRNKTFHQLQGFSKAELFSDWEVNDLEGWEKCILKFLNFIVKEDFPEGFETLEAASLMVKVHEELEKAIAAL